MSIRAECQWIARSARRERIVARLHQPLTVAQLARREGLGPRQAEHSFRDLAAHGIVECLNPTACKSRVYWLTPPGRRCQERTRRRMGLPPMHHDFPVVDWDLYGSILYRHRTAIIKAISRPMQPSAVKRRARRDDQALRMSANNARDVIKLFLKRGLVRAVRIPRQRHPRYQLTDPGNALRELILNAAAVAEVAR
jgi:hypothetical protein